jgi:hypothetical protein
MATAAINKVANHRGDPVLRDLKCGFVELLNEQFREQSSEQASSEAKQRGPHCFQTQLSHLEDCVTHLVAIAMPNINFHRRLFWCISGGDNLIDFDLNCKHLNLKQSMTWKIFFTYKSN